MSLNAYHPTADHGAPQGATVSAAWLPEPVTAICESCRHRPATTTWAHDQAGDPFTLCADCAALIPVTVTSARPTPDATARAAEEASR